MTSIVRRRIALSIVAGLAAALAAAPDLSLAEPSPTAAQEIDLLIQRVAGMTTRTFIRNGSESSADEAARHLRDKYGYFRREIQTAEDFIRLCGTRSEMTKQPYLVKTGSAARPSAEVLTEELRQIRRSRQ